MMANFDHDNKDSWYFGAISRQEATDLLMSEREGGVFLVRDSATCHGDYVLCVKEDSKVSHYIINRIQNNEGVKYRIGDRCFPDLANILSFYKLHYLDTTPLIRPASKKYEKVLAKYDFVSKEKDDLSFKKGDILTILFKDEEQWWTAKTNEGKTGLIPVPYIQKIDEGQSPVEVPRPSSGGSNSSSTVGQTETGRKSQIQRKLPAKARVKQVRVPNAYDETALKLEVGDIITVTRTNMNGQWEGELNGKMGYFPFTHVEFLDDESGS